MSLPFPQAPAELLDRIACSYGYFLLEPSRWCPRTRRLHITLNLDDADRETSAGGSRPGDPVTIRIHQSPSSPDAGPHGHRLIIRCDRILEASEQRAVKRRVVRMLRLGGRDDAAIAGFHRCCPEARRTRFGRLFRSATLWEDMVKTITGCNVAWPNTIRMNRALCRHFGNGGFPSPRRLARVSTATLQARGRVGYRAKRIIALARGFVDGRLDEAWFEHPDRTAPEVYDALLGLEGFGPYAAANVLQLLGHYDHLPIDTETYRHYCRATGTPRPSRQDPPGPDKDLDSRIREHYEPYRPFRFLAYWFHLWTDYESRYGPAWTWDREATGANFTASTLNKAD